jgi:hypothetical protein
MAKRGMNKRLSKAKRRIKRRGNACMFRILELNAEIL